MKFKTKCLENKDNICQIKIEDMIVEIKYSSNKKKNRRLYDKYFETKNIMN